MEKRLSDSSFWSAPGVDPVRGERERLTFDLLGREWLLDRAGTLDELWEAMDDCEFDEDERLPYWVEVWPASLIMARWLGDNREQIKSRFCLDVGCGLGLTAIIGAWLGARVVGFDYEKPALYFARDNARLNLDENATPPLWMLMDWRAPALAHGAFDFIWGGDIVYESRFFEPLQAMFRHVLSPEGKVWIAEPRREVSSNLKNQWRDAGWSVSRIDTVKAPMNGHEVTVNLWEMMLK